MKQGVSRAGQPATREHLRSVGDFINHAIFTDEELEGGLRRLVEAGYATDEKGLAQAAPQVMAWYEKAGPAARRSVRADWNRVKRFLGAPDWSPGDG